MAQRPVISYGVHRTPFGLCLVGRRMQGICAAAFIASRDRRDVLSVLRRSWPDAIFIQRQTDTRRLLTRLFDAGRHPRRIQPRMVPSGTPFQRAVWRAVRRIPSGRVASYTDVARWAGAPRAIRAVANAVAANPVAVGIPCHRVIRSDGGMGGYSARGGIAKKRQLLEQEGALCTKQNKKRY